MYSIIIIEKNNVRVIIKKIVLFMYNPNPNPYSKYWVLNIVK